jgi:hypothetical protein
LRSASAKLLITTLSWLVRPFRRGSDSVSSELGFVGVNRVIARTILTAAFLGLAQSVLLAQTKIEVSSRLIDYDLKQASASGESSTDTVLPRIVVASGSQGTVELTREYRYPQQVKRIIRMTVTRTAYLGIRFPIHVRDNNNGMVSFLLRVDLCERSDPTEPLSPVIKTTTSYWGERALDKTFTIELRAPHDRTARLELLLTRR